MKTELVEELFAKMVATLPHQRSDFVSAAKYPQAVKEAASRLVKAYESKSQLLNDDLLSDIARIDPDFFESVDQDSDLILQPGDRIKDYVIESIIGQGGMSVIYRAIQSNPIKRRVALKFIRPSVLAPKTVLRFFREQQALALVGHPNIATLYEVGSTPEGHPFAAMEFVNGLPITEFCRKHRMESRQRIILFLRACEGLMHAHRHGIIHRDIKPDNMLVGLRDRKPVPKLIDFGIAKFDRDDMKNNKTMTQIGQVLGSPRYMSPEQFDGKTVDQRSDIYSAGLVLFELLTRSPHRKGDTTEEIMKQARAAEPELPSRRIKNNVQDLPPQVFASDSTDALIKFTRRDLDWIIAKALAKDAQQRYPTMGSFIKDLRATLRDQPVSVSSPNPIVRLKRFANRNRVLIATTVAVILLASTAFWFVNWRSSANELTAARQANTTSEIQTAAANNLVMRLLASDMYELTTAQFEFKLIPIYQTQCDRIKASGGPKSKEDQAVYGILAVLYAMSGNFDQADELMSQVADDEQETGLRSVREKICAQYAASAKEKLRELEGEENSFERAMQQMTLGRCYIVWNMLDDGKSLLKDSIEFFDSNRPGSYESLVARNTLIKIYDQAGENENKLALLLETHEKFKDQEKLLTSSKGKSAFANVVDSLVEIDAQKYGSLKN